MNRIRVLQIGSDRSKRGILFPHTQAAKRQSAYARYFGSLDIIAFSRREDNAEPYILEELRVYPTHSPNRFWYGLDAWHILRSIPKPDVISVQDPFEAGLLALLFSKITQTPLHVQVHTDLCAPAFKLSLVNRIRTYIAWFVLRRADRIRVVSERIRKDVVEKYRASAPITVLPIYVNIDAFKITEVPVELSQKFARFTRKLLFVGRFEPEKNPCLAIQSFAESAPKETCLIMVGDGSERDYLEKLAQELHVEDRVFFEGLRDAAPYYKLADLVLVTSHYEGYGLVIIEALASGTPVLATDVGIARDAGAIVASPKTYGSALADWLISGERKAELRDYPYSNFEQYVEAYGKDISCTIAASEHNTEL